jgi:3-hydroxyethyl bacteriochlorophyllide a dehydrogenase
MQAHAVVFTAPNTVEYRPVTCPEPGPRDVVVRVTHSWISNGTEGSYLRGERIAGDTARRAGDPWPFPIVAGYQKVGLVEWIGEQVTDIVVGETVFSAMGRVEGMFSSLGGHVSPSVRASTYGSYRSAWSRWPSPVWC